MNHQLTKVFSVGLALFSMFFGAGNVIFPLALGQYAGEKNGFAILGLILTAAIMPIIGVIAMLLFEGDYKKFFGRLGKWPGFLLGLLLISLLGPLGSTPRCIALSYTTFKNSFFEISPILFSGFACLVIFLFTMRRQQILQLLGWVLTPLLLLSLLIIIIMGLMTPSDIKSVSETNSTLFLHGLKEGYNTMDLLAAFFFSSTILTLLRGYGKEEKKALPIALKASVIGAILLAAVYLGFSYLAAQQSNTLLLYNKEELLTILVRHIAGPYAQLLVAATVTLACLTTAIALIAACVDFFQKEVFKEKLRYEWLLLGALTITFMVSLWQFASLSAFLGPLLQMCYPGLIVLTLLNIAHHCKQVKPIKLPVACTFLCSLLYGLSS